MDAAVDSPRIRRGTYRHQWITTDVDTNDGFWATVCWAEATGNDGQVHGKTVILADDACETIVERAEWMTAAAVFNSMCDAGVWDDQAG